MRRHTIVFAVAAAAVAGVLAIPNPKSVEAQDAALAEKCVVLVRPEVAATEAAKLGVTKVNVGGNLVPGISGSFVAINDGFVLLKRDNGGKQIWISRDAILAVLER